jgi:ssDNA-binding Zn-finger/Zn-ribbon topoisomerase 1
MADTYTPFAKCPHCGSPLIEQEIRHGYQIVRHYECGYAEDDLEVVIEVCPTTLEQEEE